MKKVDFNKLQAGDLVEVPRTQFAPMRSGCTAGQKVICKECRIKQRIKKCSLQKKWGAAGMDGGACLGFSHDGDDEPIERCKRCIAYTSFDWDEEKERLKL